MVTGMPEVSVKHEGICKGCALGKNTKKSFSKSKNRAKGVLDLIHFDICGPMSSPSLSGCLYCLVHRLSFSKVMDLLPQGQK